jgi:hypothetical protein
MYKMDTIILSQTFPLFLSHSLSLSLSFFLSLSLSLSLPLLITVLCIKSVYQICVWMLVDANACELVPWFGGAWFSVVEVRDP